MYDPTALARHYALRAQSFVELANESSSPGRAIYLRLAEVFEGLATSAAHVAAELRGAAPLEQAKVEPQAPRHLPVPSRPKRRRAKGKSSLAPTRFTDGAATDELRH
jgi:hypothetical protein